MQQHEQQDPKRLEGTDHTSERIRLRLVEKQMGEVFFLAVSRNIARLATFQLIRMKTLRATIPYDLLLEVTDPLVEKLSRRLCCMTLCQTSLSRHESS